MRRWTEVADGVFQRRYDPLDVSVCVVRGSDGLLVVDTRSSHREANEILADLKALSGPPVRWVVNTHAHFDHSFGNYRFGPESAVNATIYGHERLPAHLAEYEGPMLANWIEQGVGPVEDWREVVITPPTVLIGKHATIDIGDRAVELIHLGRGHTDHDLLIQVPDANAWLVGDVVEESGPPMYGSGCYPLDWPDTVDRLRNELAMGAVVVSGHGAPVDPGFVTDQGAQLRAVAELIEQLHQAGVSAEAALEEGEGRWPFPTEGLATAVAQGYQQLTGRKFGRPA